VDTNCVIQYFTILHIGRKDPAQPCGSGSATLKVYANSFPDFLHSTLLRLVLRPAGGISKESYLVWSPASWTSWPPAAGWERAPPLAGEVPQARLGLLHEGRRVLEGEQVLRLAEDAHDALQLPVRRERVAGEGRPLLLEAGDDEFSGRGRDCSMRAGLQSSPTTTAQRSEAPTTVRLSAVKSAKTESSSSGCPSGVKTDRRLERMASSPSNQVLLAMLWRMKISLGHCSRRNV
jgi:hypothetical protein